MTYRFLITDESDTANVYGTNDQALADQYRTMETITVIDTLKQCVLIEDGEEIPITELK